MSIVLPIEEDPRFRKYTASEGQTQFAIPFPFQQDEDIVIARRVGPSQYSIISTTLYTIDGAGEPAGGMVTFNSGQTAGDVILVLGDAVLDRLGSIVRDGKFNSSLTDAEFDRNRIIQQEVARDLARTLKVDFGESPMAIAPGIRDGYTMMRAGDIWVEGFNAGDIGDAQENAEAAIAAAASAAASAAAAIGAANAQFRFASVASFVAANIPPFIGSVQTASYNAPGDGGAALYTKLGSAPSPAKPWHKQSADGAWWILSEKEPVPQMFGAIADGVFDCAPAMNNAVQYVNFLGGGKVRIPAGDYLVKSTISMTGCSNITLQGSGWASKIIASADLNGSDSATKNNIIGALNFSGPVTSADGYPQKNLTVCDLLVDGTLQSASGVPVGQFVGFSLAGFEVLNVDFVHVFNCKFIKCFGNGVVFGTQNPRQLSGAFQNGLRGCIAENNYFEECVRGLLPQYSSTTSPAGLAGSVMQAGSTFGCIIRNNIAVNPGGEFLNIFNSEEADVSNNVINGCGVTPVGSHPTTDLLFQQSVGMIKSDFGLVNCKFVDNVFVNTGGFQLYGNMGVGFFNDNIPTPGPRRCTIRGNKIINPTGNRVIAAPAIGASGATYTNTSSQPVRVIIFGGTGMTFTQRRGTDGSFSAATLGPSQSLLLAAGDAFTMSYSAAPSSWTWILSPNAYNAGIILLGGSISGTAGQVIDNHIVDNIITNPGTNCVLVHNGLRNKIDGNMFEAAGLVTAAEGVLFTNTFDQSGDGSQGNVIQNNTFLDQRSPIFMKNCVADKRVGAVVRTFNNRILGNRLEATTAAAILLDSGTNYVSGNYGPGWKSPVLTPPSVPASTVELVNPFSYDCYALVLGGTISAIAIGPAGATQVYGATGGLVPVRVGEVIKLTYTVAPTTFNWFAR